MPVEPSADMRQAAAVLRDAFNAFVQSGFTEDQALEIIKVLMPIRKDQR